MKFNRSIIFCILAIVCEAIPRRSLLFFHKPFFSPPPDEQHKGGILSHVLQGGIQIRPLAPLQGILEHAKKLIHGTVGRPPSHNERPNEDPPYHERPNKDHYERPNNPQIPEKEDGDPQWEDIGEVPSGEEDYGEGVLQPRRPKRFVESRIYHVPLTFRSNGRADKVRIKGRLREKHN